MNRKANCNANRLFAGITRPISILFRTGLFSRLRFLLHDVVLPLHVVLQHEALGFSLSFLGVHAP